MKKKVIKFLKKAMLNYGEVAMMIYYPTGLNKS